MRRIVIITLALSQIVLGYSQASAQKALNNGMKFDLNSGAYEFGLGGLIQVSANRFSEELSDPTYQFFPQRTFLNFYGKSNEKGLGFYTQVDFSMPNLLLDAVVSFNLKKVIQIEIGQRQNVGNNREMLIQEGNLIYADRDLLSTAFGRSGREFGVFVDPSITLGSWVVNPQISITSGDGLNSFGVDSRDMDQGGFKYSGRLDIYPFGDKIDYRNMQLSPVFNGSKTPWAVLGVYGSVNQGVSDAKGEGHNAFFLYNSTGANMHPNYRKWGLDLLFKWSRISVLAEYGIATANGLKGAYIDVFGNQKLKETQISEYLNLGNGYQLRMACLLPKQFEVFGAYSGVNQEFSNNPYSLLRSQNAWKAGLSKYVNENDLRFQISYTSSTIRVNNAHGRQLHFGAQMSF